MLDGKIRGIFAPAVNIIGASLARRGVNADVVTVMAFLVGGAAAATIAFGFFVPGLILILASRLLDALDGAVARHSKTTDRGGFLDIVLDFTFYGIVPLAFVIHDPSANALAGAVVLASFYINGSSFLAYAIMAEKRGMRSQSHATKAIYFTTGLAEATETILVFAIWCLFPAWFAVVAYIFAAICFYTAAARIGLAWQTLG